MQNISRLRVFREKHENTPGGLRSVALGVKPV
jgi:hypothetical protein